MHAQAHAQACTYTHSTQHTHSCSGDQLYRAHRDHGLIAYVAEEYTSEDGPINSYYAVAVVKASQCKEREGPLSTLSDLKVG
eukprot:1147824-Pelagomonas_calceolata.AAC.3